MTDLVKEARKRGWTTDIERHTALMMLGGEEPVGTRTLVRDVIDRLCAERDHMEGVAIRLAARVEALEAAPQWRPIADAPRDGARVLLRFKADLSAYHGPDPDITSRMLRWEDVAFVGEHSGYTASGYDIGWRFAAPVGMGGFPDEWLVGWLPLPPQMEQTQ